MIIQASDIRWSDLLWTQIRELGPLLKSPVTVNSLIIDSEILPEEELLAYIETLIRLRRSSTLGVLREAKCLITGKYPLAKPIPYTQMIEGVECLTHIKYLKANPFSVELTMGLQVGLTKLNLETQKEVYKQFLLNLYPNYFKE